MENNDHLFDENQEFSNNYRFNNSGYYNGQHPNLRNLNNHYGINPHSIHEPIINNDRVNYHNFETDSLSSRHHFANDSNPNYVSSNQNQNIHHASMPQYHHNYVQNRPQSRQSLMNVPRQPFPNMEQQNLEDPQSIIQNLVKYRKWFEQYQEWLIKYQNYHTEASNHVSKLNSTLIEPTEAPFTYSPHRIMDKMAIVNQDYNNYISAIPTSNYDLDDCNSVYSVSSKCQKSPINDSSKKVIDHLRHRSSPLLFAVAHSRVNFTNDGRLLIVSSSLTSENSTIHINSLVFSDQYFIEKYMGPLNNNNNNYDNYDLSKYIDMRIKLYSAKKEVDDESRHNLLFWMLVKQVYIHRKIPCCEVMAEILDEYLPTMAYKKLSKIARPSEYLEEHLMNGRMKESIEEAIISKQWSAAFLLSSMDPSFFATTAQKYIADLEPDDHSQTFYRTMLGHDINWNDIDWMILKNDWPIHLKMILRASVYQPSKHFHQLTLFSQHLFMNGNWSASQFVLFIAGVLPNANSENMILLGLNHQKHGLTPCNSLNNSSISDHIIQLNEIIEYSLFDNNEHYNNFRHHLLQFKLLYGILLWGRGYIQNAIDYFMEICRFSFQFDFKSFTILFLSKLYWFGYSIFYYANPSIHSQFRHNLNSIHSFLLRSSTSSKKSINETFVKEEEDKEEDNFQRISLEKNSNFTKTRAPSDTHHMSSQSMNITDPIRMYDMNNTHFNSFMDTPLISQQQSIKKTVLNEIAPDDVFFQISTPFQSPNNNNNNNNNNNSNNNNNNENENEKNNMVDGAKESNNAGPALNSQKSHSFVGGLLQKLIPTKKNNVFLPDDTQKTLVYDDSLGRWINKTDPTDQTNMIKTLPPPQNTSENSSNVNEQKQSLRNIYASKGNRYVIHR